jgi:hypothetical protein
MINLAEALLLLSFIPLGFLVYTLLNLERLSIGLSHPRVNVESLIFLVLLAAGSYLEYRGSI